MLGWCSGHSRLLPARHRWHAVLRTGANQRQPRSEGLSRLHARQVRTRSCVRWCVPHDYALEGEFCGHWSLVCGSGLYCDGDQLSCVAEPQEEEPCAPLYDVYSVTRLHGGPGLTCEPNSAGDGGSVRVRPPNANAASSFRHARRFNCGLGVLTIWSATSKATHRAVSASCGAKANPAVFQIACAKRR